MKEGVVVAFLLFLLYFLRDAYRTNIYTNLKKAVRKSHLKQTRVVASYFYKSTIRYVISLCDIKRHKKK